MRKFYLIFTCIFAAVTGYAQSGNYDIALIPDSLKKDANSVLRESNTEFLVKAADKAVLKVHEVVTVLNEADKDELFFDVHSNDFRSIGDVSLQLFDSKGKLIHKYSKS